MKVLFISGSYPPIKCGISDYIRNLVKCLGELEYRVLTSAEASKEAHVLPALEKWTWRSWKIIQQVIASDNPDIIHFQSPSVNYPRRLYITLLPSLLKFFYPHKKVIVTLHEYHDASFLGRLRILISIIFINNIIVTNHEDRIAINRVYRRKQLTLIPIGINIKKYQLSKSIMNKLKREHSIEEGRAVIYFGYVDPSKGVEQLIKSKSQWPNATKLLIIADYHASNDYHEKLKAMLEDKNDISWTGFLPDQEVSGLMQLAVAAVLPFDKPASLRRGSLLVALDHSLPTITTGPVAPPLKDRQNCYTIKDNSPENIAKALNNLLPDKDLMNTLRANASTLMQDFSWPEIGQKHIKLYNKLV